ncbi:MerR family transcriptional regulator [Agromyces sp. G08B096]|uniref:MerR family transcriptional regulator n=1 Tax=Agromyces sp. G08B096 TaxID=3156399 RepID=A0AAU7W7K5_9MICO
MDAEEPEAGREAVPEAAEPVDRPLRPVDAARAAGYSVQQVRDLERLGVIPPAQRGTNGYRRYTVVHVAALRAYRGLAAAAGPVEARALLASLSSAGVADAAAELDAVHARLARERTEALRAKAALREIGAEAEASRPSSETREDAMTITELADALGVRSSTLRFWEREGLVHPERVTTLRARRYPAWAIAEARIVAALRSAGSGIPAIREVLATLGDAGGLAHAERVLDRRLASIAARSVALLRAGADLATVIDRRGV